MNISDTISQVILTQRVWKSPQKSHSKMSQVYNFGHLRDILREFWRALFWTDDCWINHSQRWNFFPLVFKQCVALVVGQCTNCELYTILRGILQTEIDSMAFEKWMKLGNFRSKNYEPTATRWDYVCICIIAKAREICIQQQKAFMNMQYYALKLLLINCRRQRK